MISITVITVTYNAERVIERTIESVLRQRHAAIEHLIIDGASKDKTLTLARSYKERSDRANNGHQVNIVSEPDHGIYDAMNKGLKLATGDYVVFLNAGDTFHSDNTLVSISQLADSNPRPAVIYGNTDIVDEKGEFLHPRRLTPPEKLSWGSFRNGMLVCHQAFYARTDIARQQAYDHRYKYSADVDWCIRIMKEAERQQLPLINSHLTVADYLEEGQTTLHHRASLKERFHVMRCHYGLLSTLAMHAWFVIRAFIKK